MFFATVCVLSGYMRKLTCFSPVLSIPTVLSKLSTPSLLLLLQISGLLLLLQPGVSLFLGNSILYFLFLTSGSSNELYLSLLHTSYSLSIGSSKPPLDTQHTHV